MKQGGKTVLAIGPGPVTVSQGPGFQYLAARACLYLRRKGYRVVVLEDNPATLMDMEGGPEDLYMEPPVSEVVRKVAERTASSAIWFFTGGIRGWRLARSLATEGGPDNSCVAGDMDDRVLWVCGDRSLLREELESAGLANPAFRAVRSQKEGQEAAENMGFPLVVRPHFSVGGEGTGLAYNLEEFPVLLEEALRRSPTGEAVVERALVGFRKFLVTVLRDSSGKVCALPLFRQEQPLPLNDLDAVLVHPAVGAGSEGLYALVEAAKRAAEAVGFVGLAEMKMAVSPGWEELLVLDVNPQPWRHTPYAEAVTGLNLLRLHMELVEGASLAEMRVDEGVVSSEHTCVSLPLYTEGKEKGWGPDSSLAGRAGGRFPVWGRDVREVCEKTLGLVRSGPRRFGPHTLTALEGLRRLGSRGDRLRAGKEAANNGGKSHFGPEEHGVAGPGREGGESVEGETRPEGLLLPVRLYGQPHSCGETGIMFLAGGGEMPGGGHERHHSLVRAVCWWRDYGGRAAIYTGQLEFAQLAHEVADAVYLGELSPQAVGAACTDAGNPALCGEYGGKEAMACALRTGKRYGGIRTLSDYGPVLDTGSMLKGLKDRGVDVVAFIADREEALRFVEECRFPVLATAGVPGEAEERRILYSRREAEDFLESFRGEDVLLRELEEEAHEILVEAVAASWGDRPLVLWEQLEGHGTCAVDALAHYPPSNLTSEMLWAVETLAREVLDRMAWRGNISLRITCNNGRIRLWDVKPGASCDLPFLERVSGLPLVEMGMSAVMGECIPAHFEARDVFAVRMPVFPSRVLADSDMLPWPRRRSTGAVVGIATHPGVALAKVLMSQGIAPRPGGTALLSVANREKRRAVLLARELREAGYRLMATRGTAFTLQASGLEVEVVNKLHEGRPNVLDYIRNGRLDLIVNVPRGKQPRSDGFYIREDAARHGVPCITDMDVALALVRGMRAAEPGAWELRSVGEYSRSYHQVGSG